MKIDCWLFGHRWVERRKRHTRRVYINFVCGRCGINETDYYYECDHDPTFRTFPHVISDWWTHWANLVSRFIRHKREVGTEQSNDGDLPF